MAEGWGVDGAVVELGHSCCHCGLHCFRCELPAGTEPAPEHLLCLLWTEVLSAAALLLQVERAKKCLDFSFTVHFIHIVTCISYAGFPRRWEW